MDKTITVNRGDTVHIKIVPTLCGEEYILNSSDKIVFTLKKNRGDTEPLLKRELTLLSYTEDGLLLKLTSAETAALTESGYIYDCALVKGTGESAEIYTFIAPSTFAVEETLGNTLAS
ncbi:MAG: hypothetical protein LBN40_04545 [Oscillospiraceae bacterium]|jgi:hypothetical protein|nr:hypothetical protein [Oscillospiraceae bacterium]